MSVEAPARARVARLWWLTASVAVGVFVLDQLSKWWALNHLDDRDIHLVWTLRLHLTFNSGMAFGRGRGLGPVVGVLALAVVVVLLLSLRRPGSRLAAVAMGLVIGGALGNICDRIFRADSGALSGAVVDFIDAQWWPVFNVADMGVVIGGLLLVAQSVRSPRAA